MEHGLTDNEPTVSGESGRMASFDGAVYPPEYKSPETFDGSNVPDYPLKAGGNSNVPISPNTIVHSPLRMENPHENSDTSPLPANIFHPIEENADKE